MRRMYSLNQLQEIALKKIESTTNLKVFENIVDADGHKRFIEGDGTPAEITGITPTYCKWSLSGTHLMLVYAGSVENGTTIANGIVIASFNLPDWILNKIYPVWGNGIERKVTNLTASDWSKQDLDIALDKSTNSLRLLKVAPVTLTADRGFRIAFDLLIDNE